MKKIQSILAVFVLAFGIISCSKEGPVGPQGEQGPQGPQGQHGSAGVDTYTWTTTSSNWGWDAGGDFWYSELNIPQLTSSIFNNGAVIVYRSDGASYWYALPRTALYTTTVSRFERFVYTTGLIKTIWQYSNSSQYYNPGTITFKTVLISGDGLKANPNLDINNYSEVKKAFNLPN